MEQLIKQNGQSITQYSDFKSNDETQRVSQADNTQGMQNINLPFNQGDQMLAQTDLEEDKVSQS